MELSRQARYALQGKARAHRMAAKRSRRLPDAPCALSAGARFLAPYSPFSESYPAPIGLFRGISGTASSRIAKPFRGMLLLAGAKKGGIRGQWGSANVRHGLH